MNDRAPDCARPVTDAPRLAYETQKPAAATAVRPAAVADRVAVPPHILHGSPLFEHVSEEERRKIVRPAPVACAETWCTPPSNIPTWQRIAGALLQLTQRPGSTAWPARTTEVPLPHRDLAEFVGTNVYTVSRILSRWKRAGIVESRRGCILIRSGAELTRIAEGRMRAAETCRGPVLPRPTAGAGITNVPQPCQDPLTTRVPTSTEQRVAAFPERFVHLNDAPRRAALG